MAMNQDLLEVRDLSVSFFSEAGEARAVEKVSFSIRDGETVGLVGESGCGKSVTALSILRLVPDPPGRITGGAVSWAGRDLRSLSDDGMRAIRGNAISMIFQEPMTSLNPVFTVGEQIAEAVRIHQKLGRKEADARAVEMLRRVRIPSPEARARAYPHQMSGGMQQRAMIAMALACEPKLLIADEPTTALDVTIQAQILALLRDLQKTTRMAVLLITHDLAVVGQIADRILVMYAGRIIEEAPSADLFASPQHPYAAALFRSLPSMAKEGEPLYVIPGSVPDPAAKPAGCPFHPRCDRAVDPCRETFPPMKGTGPGRRAACWNHVSSP